MINRPALQQFLKTFLSRSYFQVGRTSRGRFL